MIIMQEPNEEVEASIPPLNVRDDPDLHRTFTARRKAAKRTLPWDLQSGKLELVSSQLPQDEDIPATKKRRLEEPFSVSAADEVATTFSTLDTAVSLPTDEHADAVPAKVTQTIDRWTLEEDTKLTGAVTNICKMNHGKEYRVDWVAVAALVPCRTKQQCKSRWQTLDANIGGANRFMGTWTEDEDSKLRDAVKGHGGKDWGTISALVPGRTKIQCHQRWPKLLDPSIDRATGRTCKWAEGEDSKLKDAVQTHGGKNWDAIAALVPGRNKNQCWSRWRELPLSFRVERELSVGADGVMSWIPTSTVRMEVLLNEEKTKTAG
jgi:hypothetical protein